MITLVTPPSTFLLDQRVFISLGILKVGASLEQAGVAVDHLDLTGVRNYLDVVHDYLRSSPSRCFALTATTPQMPAATSIAQIIRPHAKVILGGPHPTLVAHPRRWPSCFPASMPSLPVTESVPSFAPWKKPA
jgi:radical SAM superfamily enzyme YgiQ (UPF0313 family)